MLDTASATSLYGSLDFDYDAVGNRTQRSSDTGSGPVSDLYLYPVASNKLQSIDEASAHDRDLEYDDAGNVTRDERAGGNDYTYTYNLRGRMSKVSLGGVLQAEYVYNALGQQVIRKLPQALGKRCFDPTYMA